MEGSSIRGKILSLLYKWSPFDLKGDCIVPPCNGPRISCIINFYGRLDLLRGILFSLASQQYPCENFEVILVEDRGGTPDGSRVADEFAQQMNVKYASLPEPYGLMGHSRNFGVMLSRGEILLFLDDDTVILQDDFLATLDRKFQEQSAISAVVPRGRASFALYADHYDFHDEYFMTSRCTAYRRDAVRELGGFVSDFVGQEDVEFVVRFTLAGKKSSNCPDLTYFHPPLLVPNFHKPKAVGHSFFRLRHRRYPLLLWILLLVNCARHAPLYFLPIRRYREMGRFGVGFICGVVASFFKAEDFRYS